MKIFLVILFVLTTFYLQGQIGYVCTGKNGIGICLGNAPNSDGLRLNLWDHHPNRINGISLSVNSSPGILNGLSVGILASDDYLSNGIQICGLIARAHKHNGISFGGLGISGTKFNGIGFSGFVVYADTLNGFFAGPLGVIARDSQDTISIIQGVAIGGGNTAFKLNGLCVGYLLNKFEKQNGVSIAGINIASELHGLQFGLINCAMNNKKPFRWIPLVNLHFRRNPLSK